MFRLIGHHERDNCTSANDYLRPHTVNLTDYNLLVPYDWCEIFEPYHNGACVYECYAERMKIHWTAVAKKALSFRGKDLKKSK